MKNLPTTADQMFCFAVYTASHAINRTYLPMLNKLGLTYPQYITLTLLWESDGQSVGHLSQKLGMKSSTLTPLLKRLEGLELVTRTRGKEDERQVFVHLTKAGRALQKRAPDITACLIEETGMSMAELDALVGSLKTLTANLSEKA